MKRRNFILSLSSLLFGFIFLAGSTGINLIIHNCPSCHDFSVTAGIYLAPEEPEDHCCEAAANHCTAPAGITFESTCCHFTIEKLRLTTFSSVVPLLIASPAELPSHSYLADLYHKSEITSFSPEPHNKHGGRDLITYHCQLIS